MIMFALEHVHNTCFGMGTRHKMCMKIQRALMSPYPLKCCVPSCPSLEQQWHYLSQGHIRAYTIERGAWVQLHIASAVSSNFQASTLWVLELSAQKDGVLDSGM